MPAPTLAITDFSLAAPLEALRAALAESTTFQNLFTPAKTAAQLKDVILYGEADDEDTDDDMPRCILRAGEDEHFGVHATHALNAEGSIDVEFQITIPAANQANRNDAYLYAANKLGAIRNETLQAILDDVTGTMLGQIQQFRLNSMGPGERHGHGDTRTLWYGAVFTATYFSIED